MYVRKFVCSVTPEYQTLIGCTSILITTVKNHLTDLSALLLQRYLITADQESEMSNNWHYEADRAAKLVELIRDKVEQNPKCYHAFIEALEEDQSTNQDILTQLKTKYDSLSGGEQILCLISVIAFTGTHNKCVHT